MDNNEKKKGSSWFANLGSSQSKNEEKVLDTKVNENTEVNPQVTKDDDLNPQVIKDSEETPNIKDDNILLSKDKQDKIVLDLIVSLENMIKDRELLIYKNKDIEEQLLNTNETVSQINADLMKNDQLLMEKNKQILGLKNILTNKQMVYDQLLEDYKEYQNSSTTSYEKVSIQLDGEVKKYNQLNEEFKNEQYQNMLKLNKLEENLRSLQVENKQYEEQYKKVFDEKTELLKTINAFTEQMSSSLSLKLNTNSSDTE